MTAAGWIWVAVAAGLAVLDWAAVAAGSRLWERCAKPAVLLALLAAAVTAQPQQDGVHGWLVLALCLGLIGDVALSFAAPGHPVGQPADQSADQAVGQPVGTAAALEPASTGQQPLAPGTAAPTTTSPVSAGSIPAGSIPAGSIPAVPATAGSSPTASAGGAHRARPPASAGRTRAEQQPSALFAAGLGCFLLGHLCYCAAMLNYGTDQLSLGFGLVLVLLALLAFGHRVLTGAQRQGGNSLAIAVAAYIAALGSTVVLGIGTTSLWVAYGILAFAISDLVLASDRFVARRGWAPLTVAITYHLAQTLLLVGLVH
ncbi:MAG TPA: lysoplasmalogenase family protein [Jatrophihabitans sp.]|jgi:uncharacterized membrane protein YhhN|uniref:lysoplasmalogenase family protein n=1 Tax=Jatrophihabitans sp. TaxID=1932789 RepID=UPI002F1200BE